ncbi:MAG: FtsX-like permease family protein [Flavobacteriales bacterium]
MNLRFFIARRYLFSRKSHAVINLISLISVVSVCLITAAMVIILSAINGFETIVEDLYGEFDPDLKIAPVNGKSFELSNEKWKKISGVKGIHAVTRVVEETGIIKSGEKWVHATLKGVEKSYFNVSRVGKHIDNKGPFLENNGAVAGSLVASRLGIYANQALGIENMVIYAPLRSKRMGFTAKPFSEERLTLTGVFRVNPEYDDKYVLMDFGLLREMLEYENDVSYIEIALTANADEDEVIEALEPVIGKKLKVITRYQINEIIYKTNRAEKWFTFLILMFVMLLAAVNIVSSLTMLVIDKRNDMRTLKVLGAESSDLRSIFFIDGMIINLMGGLLGVAIGAIFCFLQEKYHFVSLGNAVIDYYPVKLLLSDLVWIFFTLLGIGCICSWFPTAYLVKRHNREEAVQPL